MAKLKGWRTVILNFFMGFIPVWETFVHALGIIVPTLQEYGIAQYLPPNFLVYYMAAMAIANIILRFKTDTPIGKAE